jgi:hypothetical protein
MILTLTIPQPSIPSIEKTGRTNVTIKWSSSFVPPASDKTAFGFNISVCDLANSFFWSTDHHMNTTYCKYFSFLRGDKTNGLVESLLFNNGRETRVFSATLTTLLPNSRYRLRACSFIGTSQSGMTGWSTGFTTQSESPPSKILGEVLVSNGSDITSLQLSFEEPVDDGGWPITGYNLYFRNHNHDFTQDWFYHGYYDEPIKNGGLKLLVDSLLPNCLYDFQITAVNELGESEPSRTSSKTYCCMAKNEENTNIRPNYPVVFGIDGFKRIKPTSTSYMQKVLTVHDRDQSLSIMGDDSSKLSVWSAHSSPKAFILHGFLAHGDSDYNGKIATFSRDDEPISVKVKRAQNAGAIACIIIDDGKCTSFDQKCMPGSDKSKGEYFAEVDPPTPKF